MTRLDYLPAKQPAVERSYTPQEDELRKVRHRLSMQAARVGMKGVGLESVIEAVEAELVVLRRISDSKPR